MQNRTLGPYLAAISRILIQVMGWGNPGPRTMPSRNPERQGQAHHLTSAGAAEAPDRQTVDASLVLFDMSDRISIFGGHRPLTPEPSTPIPQPGR
jgi:hypothetical protein